MTTDRITEKLTQCASCGKKAKRVGTVTLRALLKDEFAREFGGSGHSCCGAHGEGETGCAPVSSESPWRFCDSQDCDVVYFSEADGRVFTKSQLKVAVGVKESTGERPLC